MRRRTNRRREYHPDSQLLPEPTRGQLGIPAHARDLQHSLQESQRIYEFESIAWTPTRRPICRPRRISLRRAIALPTDRKSSHFVPTGYLQSG